MGLFPTHATYRCNCCRTHSQTEPTPTVSLSHRIAPPRNLIERGTQRQPPRQPPSSSIHLRTCPAIWGFLRVKNQERALLGTSNCRVPTRRHLMARIGWDTTSLSEAETRPMGMVLVALISSYLFCSRPSTHTREACTRWVTKGLKTAWMVYSSSNWTTSWTTSTTWTIWIQVCRTNSS